MGGRLIDRELGGRRPVAHCSLCSRSTSGHKPVCVKHVLEMPYARGVELDLAERTREARTTLTSRPRIDVEGCRAREIRELLEHAPMTVGEISRAVMLDLPDEFRSRKLRTTRAYVRALEAAGIVDVERVRDRLHAHVIWTVSLRRELATPAIAPVIRRRATGS